MKELLNLTGHYNASISFNEDENHVYFTTNSATSMLAEDVQRIKQVFDAEKAEIYSDKNAEYNFLIQLELPEEKLEEKDL